jgi:hypothetical protein
MSLNGFIYTMSLNEFIYTMLLHMNKVVKIHPFV